MNPQVEAVIIVLVLIGAFLATALFLMPRLFAGIRGLGEFSPRLLAWLEPLLFLVDDQRIREILSQPFTKEWADILLNCIPHYSLLSGQEKAKLRNAVQIFIAQKHWEGCQGLTLTDEMKVTIAGYACLLTLGMRKNYFPRVKTILVYPGGFRVPRDYHATDLVNEETMPVLGVAWHRGPVILSWDEIVRQASAAGTKGNLVIHEFAHQLDMQGGPADGTPQLPDTNLQKKWRSIMKKEYERLLEEFKEGGPSLLDHYGSVSEVEFFAVASECFFEQPVEMKREHPELYEVLRRYYRQDPAVRWLQHSAS